MFLVELYVTALPTVLNILSIGVHRTCDKEPFVIPCAITPLSPFEPTAINTVVLSIIVNVISCITVNMLLFELSTTFKGLQLSFPR